MDKMNKRRLLKLADLLEADAKDKKGVKFDLSSWIGPWTYTKPDELPSIGCGTTACAMGLAVLSGAFKRACHDLHLYPEMEEHMDQRLGDWNREHWDQTHPSEVA